MLKMKKILAMLISVMLMLSLVPSGCLAFAYDETPVASAEAAEVEEELTDADYVISLDETINVSADDDGVYVKFVPEISHTYKFESLSTAYDTYGHILDSEYNILSGDDDSGENTNFALIHYLEAGETYYYLCSTFSELSVFSYDVTISLKHIFDRDATPPTTESDGFSVNTCEECGYSYEEILPKANIINLNESADVKITDDVAGMFLIFTPEIGHHYLFGADYSECSPYFEIYNSDFDLIYSSWYTAYHMLEAGETYYIWCSCEEYADIAKYRVKLSLEHNIQEDADMPTKESEGKIVYTCYYCDYSYEIILPAAIEIAVEETVTLTVSEGYSGRVIMLTPETDHYYFFDAEDYSCEPYFYIYNSENTLVDYDSYGIYCYLRGGETYYIWCTSYEPSDFTGFDVTLYLEHDIQKEIDLPTTTENGKVVYTCSDCGYSYEEILPPVYEITENETVSLEVLEGFEGRLLKFIPENDHRYEIAADIYDCSPVLYVYNDENDVVSSGWYSVTAYLEADEVYYIFCTSSSSEDFTGYDVSIIGEHEFEKEAVLPTAISEGKLIYTCTYCGYVYEEVLPAAYEISENEIVSLVASDEYHGRMLMFTPSVDHKYLISADNYRCSPVFYIFNSDGDLLHEIWYGININLEAGETYYIWCSCPLYDAFTGYNVSIVGRHSYEKEVTMPTKESNGCFVYTCICGYSYEEAFPAAAEIADNETVSLDALPGFDGRMLMFTPAADHYYIFSTKNYECQPILYIYNSEGDLITDSWYSLSMFFEGGETYYIYCTCSEYEEFTGYDVTLTGEHSYEKEVTLPTTESNGSVIYTCRNCGYSYEEILPAVYEITENETVNLEATEGFNGRMLMFTPEADHYYKFYSENYKVVPAFYIYDAEYRLISYDRYSVYTYLKAGKTYYIWCTCDEDEIFIGNDVKLIAEHEFIEEITMPTAEQEGSCVYRCEYCDYMYSQAIPVAYEISTDEIVTVEYIDGYDGRYVMFTPEVTHIYSFSSLSPDYDTYCTLYNSDGERIDSDDDSGSDSNFKLKLELEAGETYYFYCRRYNRDAFDSFDVAITTEHIYSSEVRLPTSESNGSVIYTCTGCGYSYEEILPAAYEISDGETVTLEASEDFSGSMVIFTSEYDHEYIIAAENYSCYPVIYIFDSEYNIIASGWYNVYCYLSCGETYYFWCTSSEDEVYTGYDIKLFAEHEMKEEITMPTAEQEGSIVHSCEYCTYSYSEIIPVAYEISLNETVSVEYIDGYEGRYVMFTPEVTHGYSFRSLTDYYDTYCTLYDSDGKWFDSDDDSGNGSNFDVMSNLEAGKTYYFYCRCYDGDSFDSFDVTIDIMHNYSEHVTLPTAESEGVRSYICDYCDDSHSEVIPVAYNISVDETVTVEYVDGHDGRYLVFTPDVTHVYSLSSAGDGYSKYCEVYDSNNNVIYFDNYHERNDNFMLSATLEAGKTYYFYCGCYNDAFETFDVTLTAEHNYSRNVIREPDCEQSGIVEFTCNDCGDKYQQEIPVRHVDNDNDGFCDTCGSPDVFLLELAFIVDTTGSMDDDINAVKDRMSDILSGLDEDGINYRIALIDYRDFPDRTGESEDYPYMLQLDFSSDHDSILNAIYNLELGNGGDWEETLYSALVDGMSELTWTRNSSKCAIIMGDAPPLDPEPYTNYTLDIVKSVLNGISVSSGYTPDTYMSSGDETAEAYDIDESFDISAVVDGETISIFSITTASSTVIEQFDELSEATGGKSFTSESAEVGDLIDDIVSALPDEVHYHSFTSERIEPTCTQDGMILYTCECGATKENDIVPALGHAIVNHEAQEVSCTEIGWNAYETCSRCDYSTYSEIAALGHDMVELDAQEATCTKPGYSAHYGCSRCEEFTLTEVPALGHAIVSHAAKAATCTEIGWNAYETCSRCDYTTYEEIAALGHAIVSHAAKAATCTEIGWNAYETCSRCDYTTYEEIAALGHNKVSHAAKAATCTEIGWNAYETCSRCDYTTYEEIAALGHNKVSHAAKAATCTEIGWNAYETCSRCDYTTYEEIAALGHNQVSHAAKAATCTEIGWNAYETCSRCDYTTYEEIAALGHNKVSHAAKVATCTEIGWNAYETCSRCDYTTYEEIAALGHAIVSHAAKAATCTEIGWNTYETCSRCDYTTYEEIAALGHNKVSHAAKAATCTEIGWNAYETCSRCDYTTYKQIGINANNHANTVKVPAVDATTDKVGYTEGVFCNDCKKYISGHKEIDKISASFKDSENAKRDGNNIIMNAGLSQKDLLALASDGAVIKDQDGKAVAADKPVGTGMILVLSDSTQLELVVFGDADGDGGITASDARLALRASVKLENYAEASAQYKASNVDSEKLTASDARLILRASVNLEKLDAFKKN